MTSFSEFAEGFRGLWELITRKPGAIARFNVTQPGVMAVLGLYVTLVLLTIVAQIALRGMPPPFEIAVGIGVNLLPALSVALACWLTASVLKPSPGFVPLLVPGLYGLCVMVVVGVPLSMFGPSASAGLVGMFGYLAYVISRQIGKLSVSISLAFAILNVVALVALPLALYIVLAKLAPAPPLA